MIIIKFGFFARACEVFVELGKKVILQWRFRKIQQSILKFKAYFHSLYGQKTRKKVLEIFVGQFMFPFLSTLVICTL